MKRKIPLFLMVLLLLFQSFAAAASPIAVEFDGQPFSSGLISGNTTYIPLRTLLNTLDDWSLQWDAANHSALARTSQGRTLRAGSGQGGFELDGISYSWAQNNFVQDGSFYIPLRLVCSTLGLSVGWEGSRRTAYISSVSTSYTQDELYWLARIIYAESGGESLEGQIAVGNIVLNRVASPQFPNDIYNVIFDRENGVQFEPVSNGTVYNDPSPLSYTAARMALEGCNVIGSCLYFFNPSLSQGTWIAGNRSYYRTIGCHRFYL